MQKTWKKPECVILLRSRPEESVLDSCKTANAGTTPGVIAQNCGGEQDSGRCINCMNRGGQGS